MAITVQLESSSEQEKRFVNKGWQCPECYGPNVSNRTTRFDAQPIGFLCTDCGCQWDKNYYPEGKE